MRTVAEIDRRVGLLKGVLRAAVVERRGLDRRWAEVVRRIEKLEPYLQPLPRERWLGVVAPGERRLPERLRILQRRISAFRRAIQDLRIERRVAVQAGQERAIRRGAVRLLRRALDEGRQAHPGAVVPHSHVAHQTHPGAGVPPAVSEEAVPDA